MTPTSAVGALNVIVQPLGNVTVPPPDVPLAVVIAETRLEVLHEMDAA